MIACASFSRINLVWKAANPFRYSQVCFLHYNMSKTNDESTSMNQNNKRKAIKSVWKPVSAGSASDEGLSCSASMNQQNKQKTMKSVWRPVSPGSASHEVYIAKELKVLSIDSHETVHCSERPAGGCQVHESQGNLPESLDCRTISESEKAIKEEQVKGKTLAKLSVPLEVDASLIRFVKGKGGSTQKTIEEATGVKIIFPSSKEDNQIILEGLTNESVAKASKIIASVLDEVVKSPQLDYSHFISLPLAIYPELVEKLQKFQNDILGVPSSGFDGNSDSDSSHDSSDVGDDDKQPENRNFAVKLEIQGTKEPVAVKMDTKSKSAISSDLGIDKSIFIKPKTFHLTVLMLKLWNKDLLATASEILQKISLKVNDALDDRPVSIKLKGLDCMRGSPAKARVLYAPVVEVGGEGRLLRACQVIIEAYVEAGLVLEKDARQALKLHATLMNARHRKWKKGTKKHDTFDARWILRRYGSEEWGDYVIREAHLSRRFSFDESGYYHCCASIPFPESRETKDSLGREECN